MQLIASYHIAMPSLRTLHMQLSTSIPMAGRQWMRLVENALAHHQISGACAIPLLLIGRSGGIHQVALAEEIGIMGPSMVRLLDRLCSAELVLREQDAHDRRAKRLWLTEAGKLLADELEERLSRLRMTVFKDLTEAELLTALKVNEQLSGAVSKLEHDASRRRRESP